MDRELELLRVHEGEDEPDRETLQQLLVDISWREEALHALLWVLRLVEDLPPDQMCPKQPVYGQGSGPGPAIRARRRQDAPAERDRDVLDFCYCLHWHARTAQYHGDVWDCQIPRASCSSAAARWSGCSRTRREDVDLAV